MRSIAALILSALLLSPAIPAAPAAGSHAGNEVRLPSIRLHGDALTGKARPMTVEQLELLGPPTDWTILDPYKRRNARYQGIQLKDLVAALAPDAQHVRMRAVNDYVTVFERREWETLPILLATRDSGARMNVANKGPARIVYRHTAENERKMQVHAPKWIWQVIDVEFIAR
ncbi:MAG: hypothetical protein ACOY3X_01405 [Pseudomonadota bacterium]